jgi:hypothetical protein
MDAIVRDSVGSHLRSQYAGMVGRHNRNRARYASAGIGSQFEKDCKQINYEQLEQIWAQQYQDQASLPESIATVEAIEIGNCVKPRAERGVSHNLCLNQSFDC